MKYLISGWCDCHIYLRKIFTPHHIVKIVNNMTRGTLTSRDVIITVSEAMIISTLKTAKIFPIILLNSWKIFSPGVREWRIRINKIPSLRTSVRSETETEW